MQPADSPSDEPFDWVGNPYPDYDRSIEEAIRFSGVTLDFFTAGKARKISQLARKHLSSPQASSCLDIGCGTGNIHASVEGEFASLMGIDIASEALTVAKTRNAGVSYTVYDGSTIPFEDEVYDFAYTICVMHHVPPRYWGRFMTEAFRILRPGGRMAVFEHNPLNPLTRLGVARCPFDEGAVLLKPWAVRKLMQASGFVDIRSEYMFLFPMGGSLGGQFNDAFGWLPLGAQYVVSGSKPIREEHVQNRGQDG